MKVVLMVGPPGSGKSTYSNDLVNLGYTYINQDTQGPEHLDLFEDAINAKKPVVVDRMGFSVEQRNRYLKLARAAGYETEIVVLHESRNTCFARMMKRENHPTIKDEKSAKSALNTFFSKYERVQDSEADSVKRIWPIGEKPLAIWSDLDGTLCEIEHRRHHVRKEGKKDWASFFKEMNKDTVNEPVMQTLRKFAHSYEIVYCSGRPEDHRSVTTQWLFDNEAPNGHVFMRPRNDSRQDNIVKEILLDFEVQTRYSVFFCLDDRDQVVKMLRSRGLTVFQVAPGDF